MYAFYSQEAVNKGSQVVIWQTENGGEVECTAVSNDIHGETYQWEDKRFVGKVTKYLRHKIIDNHLSKTMLENCHL